MPVPRKSVREAIGKWLVQHKTTVIIIACCAYFAAFLAFPLSSVGGEGTTLWRRVHLVTWLLLPEEWLELWFGRPAEFAFLDRLIPFGLAAFLWLWAFAWGWGALALLGVLDFFDRAEKWLFAGAVGVNLISTFILAFGLAGYLGSGGTLWAVVFVSVVLGGGSAARLFVRRIMPKRHGVKTPGQLAYAIYRKIWMTISTQYYPRFRKLGAPHPQWLWGGILAFGILIVLGSVLPPIEFDVREYHLQAPKEFFLAGRIHFLSHNVYANMPLAAEMLPLAAMVLMGDWWVGALAGKLAQSGYTFLLAVGLLTAGRRLGAPSMGVTACFLFLSTPWVVQIASLGLVEWAWACYGILAWYAWALWAQHLEQHSAEIPPSGQKFSQQIAPRRGSPRRASLLVLACYLAGAAAGCKYPALVFVCLPMFVATLWVAVGRQFLPETKIFTLGSSARGGFIPKAATKQKLALKEPRVSCPVQNARDAKAGRTTDALNGAGSRWSSPQLLVGAAIVAMSLGGGLWYLKNAALTGNPFYPLLGQYLDGKTRNPELVERWNRAHRPTGFSPAQALRDGLRITVGSDWLSPLVWPFAVLGWAKLPWRIRWAMFTYAAWWFAIWWVATHRIDRFWLPLLPYLCLAGGTVWQQAEPQFRKFLMISLLVFGAGNLFVSATVAAGYPRYFVPLTRLREDPTRVDPWVLRLNRDHTVGRVLVVGQAAVFDFQMPILYNTCFDREWLEWLAKGRSPEEFRAELRRWGITHILVHWGEIARYRSPGNYGFSAFVTPQLFTLWESMGILEKLPEIPGYPIEVFRVREGPAKHPADDWFPVPSAKTPRIINSNATTQSPR